MFSFFGPKPSESAAPAPAAPVGTTGAPGAPAPSVPAADNLLGGTGVSPATGVAGTPAASESPLDKFAKVWQNTTTEGQGPKQYVTVDQTKLAQAVGQLNFASAIKPEQFQAMANGGEGAVQAFQQAMNTVAQQVFQTAMLGTGKLMENALQNSRGDMVNELPGLMKHQLSMNQMAEKYPGITHPAVRPLMEVLQSQFAAQDPNATPAEIQQLASDYLMQVTNLMNPQSGKSGANSQNGGATSTQMGAQSGGIDWDNFFKPS